MTRICAIFLNMRAVALFFILLLLACPAEAAQAKQEDGQAKAKPVSLNARSAILAEAETGLILFQKNPDAIRDPASLTKIMTMYVLFEHMSAGEIHAEDVPKISAKAASTGGSTMFLSRSDTPTVVDLLYGLAVWSGNDAAVTLAEHAAGSVDAFVAEMNQAAAQMGLASTVFKTPTGLTAAGQHTTARDMLNLTRAYLNRFPGAIAYHQTPEFAYQGTSMENTNPLLGEYEGADGLKTGHTGPAGFNLVATAKRDGVRLIAVVLGSSTKAQREADAKLLLDTGFAMLDNAYLVRMEAWKDAQKALQTRDMLDRLGYRASLDESGSGKDAVHSVLVGPYADEEAARAARDELREQGFSPKYVLHMTRQGGALRLVPVQEKRPATGELEQSGETHDLSSALAGDGAALVR